MCVFRGNDFLPKIDPKLLIKAILREFNDIVLDEERFKLPIIEALKRLNRKEYYIYPVTELERHWCNIAQNAIKHRKNDTMNEVDRIYFQILNSSQEYRKKGQENENSSAQ